MDISHVLSGMTGGGLALLVAKIWLENAKIKWQHESKAWIEDAKIKWQYTADKYQFVYKLKFETEFRAYQRLWKTVAVVQDAALALRPIFDTSPTSKQERLKDFGLAYTKFRECCTKNEPFLAAEVASATHDFAKKITNEAFSYEHEKPSQSYWQEAHDNQLSITSLANAIRDRIRNITHGKQST